MTDPTRTPEPEAPSAGDVQALQLAFEQFIKTTSTLEEAYQQLQGRVDSLDRELEEKNRALALTTEYLNSILDSMSDGVVAVDTADTITTFNRAAREILGFTTGEVMGKPFAEVFARPFGESGKLTDSELKTSAGETISVSERTSPVAGDDGRRIGLVKVFQDLTEIESLRERVRRKDRLAAIGEMAATVAHEIRNPLGGIRGFAALLERDLADGDKRKRLVEKILIGTRNLDAVVNELLEYTRPIELRKGSCNLRELVEAATGLAGIDPDHARVINEVDESLTLHADEDRLRQVFLNILINAAQSVAGGGSIRITSSEDGEEVEIAIADDGAGIAPEHIGRIFSPFFTTKEKGTGLGLAVAAKTVESHGGALSVSSEPKAGATFRVRLPRGDRGES